MTSVPAVLASLTKGAPNAATKSLAIECAGKGVRVNAVSPGIIKTPMHPAEEHQILAKLHPMGRMGETSDIVEGGAERPVAPIQELRDPQAYFLEARPDWSDRPHTRCQPPCGPNP